ncbi:hypothetical protein [Roseivirga pacifica]|nr:hypothetical protein [Roseivirga pacifica]MCO6358551.1 hypothetical protein [Roseivirga pacifica]MCO6372190.1 hypothetical protein [Roseivirga pacifica]MCO6374282.1 hypothetical protein [Roseivirga pacifica]
MLSLEVKVKTTYWFKVLKALAKYKLSKLAVLLYRANPKLMILSAGGKKSYYKFKELVDLTNSPPC